MRLNDRFSASFLRFFSLAVVYHAGVVMTCSRKWQAEKARAAAEKEEGGQGEEAVQAGEKWKAAVLERGKQDREKMRQEEEERLRVARLQVSLFAFMVECVRLGMCLCMHTCVCTSVHMFMYSVSPHSHICTKICHSGVRRPKESDGASQEAASFTTGV